jgi:hypothetical protein
MLDPNQTYTFGSPQKQVELDPNIQYLFGSDNSARELKRNAPMTGTETAIMIGLDVIPAIAGNIAGSIAGPVGVAVGGGTGGFLGNYWSQKYRISRGLQDDIGIGELGASTILSGIPLGTPAKSGMATKTAIRAAQGAGLSGADVAARTIIDEGRLPTDKEVATSLLFGGVFGGGMGAVEAKWFSKTTGVNVEKDMPRDEVIDAVQEAVQEAGGPSNFDPTQKIGFFTFRDKRGELIFNDPVVDELTTTSGLATNNALGPRRLNRLDQAELPGPRGLPGPQQKQLTNRVGRPGDDAVLVEAEVLDAMSPREYAEGLLSGIESKLLLETNEQIQKLAKTQDTTPEIQSLKNLFEQKIANDSEIFTGVNPVIAKGEAAKLNLPATKRLREIDKELDKMYSDLSQEPFFVIDTSLRKLNRKDLEKLRLSKLKESRQLDSQIKTSSDEIKFGKKLHKVDKELQSIELEQWRRRQEDNVEFYLKHKNKGNVTIQGLTSTSDERKSDLVNDILENLRIDAGDSEVKVAIALDTLKKHNLEELLEDGLRNKRFFYGTQVEKSDADFLLDADIKSLVNIHAKYFGKKPANNSSHPKLIAEKRSLEKKHGINSRSFLPLSKDGPFTMDNILPATVGLAGFAATLSEDEEKDLAQAGGWGITLAAVASAFGVKNKKATKAIANGVTKATVKNNSDAKVRAKGKKPKPDPKPANVTNKKGKDVTDPRHYETPELIDIIRSSQTNEQTKIQALTVLAERASRNTTQGIRLAKQLEQLAIKGKAENTKVQVDPNEIPLDLTTPQGRSDILTQNTIQKGFRSMQKGELLEQYYGGNNEALEELSRRAAKNPKTKKFMEKHDLITGLLSTGAGASAVLSMYMDDEDEMMKAGFDGAHLLAVLAVSTLGYKAAKSFFKSNKYKNMKAQARRNPDSIEPTIVKEEFVKKELQKNAFTPPGAIEKTYRNFREIVSDALSPLSRKLRNINPAILRAVRAHDGEVNKRTAEYINRSAPFLKSMNGLLKNKKEYQELFENHLLNGRYNDITKDILDKLNASDVIKKQMKEMRVVLDEVRTYARERGGLDVGYLEEYFPRIIQDYKSFRKALDGSLDQSSKNDIDRALKKYADKNYNGIVDAITDSEASEVVSRVLRGFPLQAGMSPGNTKTRKIAEVTREMQPGYKKPGDALVEYIQRMVQATERRNFFYKKPKSTQEVGFEGSKDRIGADLGVEMEASEGIASVVNRLQKENNLSQDDVEALQKLISSRFSGTSVGSAFQAIKNLNYISTMGNFGSAITQLGDFAYSVHFAGFDNTFKSIFNRKFDFVKHFGLNDANIDLIGSAGFTQAALDKVFTVTQLKRLDQFAKNTLMNSLWRKQKQLAHKDARALIEELKPAFGDRAKVIVRDLQQSNPNSKDLPKSVEELVWYKFLDLNPATMTEMPGLYARSGNGRIAYMLKSFTIKQFDVFRQAGVDDIQKAKALYDQGKKGQAASLATEGVKKLASLSAVFMAANASTDVIKDTMYGRPTKLDDLLTNNILKLVGVNRYMAYEAKRKGAGSVVGQTLLPPFTLYDRFSKDLINLFEGKEYKGNLLQGTPLDVFYWHYLGGLDKVDRMK